MAIKTIDDTNLTAIANAIRAKGVEGTFKPSEMATAIGNIQSGGSDAVFNSDIVVSNSKNSFYITAHTMGGDAVDTYHYLFSGNTIRETSNINITLQTNTNNMYGIIQVQIGWKNDDGTMTYGEGVHATATSKPISVTINPQKITGGGLDKNLVIVVIHRGGTLDTALVTWNSPNTPTIAEEWFTDKGGKGLYPPTVSLETAPFIASATQGTLEMTYNSTPLTLYTAEGGSF